MLVGISMLPLLLTFLSTEQFLLWSLFITIAGGFLQVETAIQALLARNIARFSLNGPRSQFIRSRINSCTVYRRFTTFVLLVMGLGGGLYLFNVDADQLDRSWLHQWCIFLAAYCFNYFCAHNNALLIGAEKTVAFNLNNIISRLTNLGLTALFLVWGYGVYGLAISFAASVLLGCNLNAFHARATTRKLSENLIDSKAPDSLLPSLSGIIGFAGYLLLSYWIYRSSLLVVAAGPNAIQKGASLAFALQVFAIFVTLSLTPIQMRVAPLIEALKAKKTADTGKEFARIHLLVNAGFILCCVALFTGSGVLEKVIPSDFAMPDPILLGFLALGFLVEINLQCFANVLIGLQKFSFIRYYAFSLFCALVILILVAIISGLSVTIVISIILICQLVVSCSFFVKAVKLEISITRSHYGMVLLDTVQWISNRLFRAR